MEQDKSQSFSAIWKDYQILVGCNLSRLDGKAYQWDMKEVDFIKHFVQSNSDDHVDFDQFKNSTKFLQIFRRFQLQYVHFLLRHTYQSWHSYSQNSKFKSHHQDP